MICIITAFNVDGALLRVVRVLVKVHGTGKDQRQPVDIWEIEEICKLNWLDIKLN